ncbi:MAG: glycine cleavage system aminomethyltransferase GcvT [Halobacteriales archaeon]|nr:glycine cleavage system aminomethyltransferase GcvT [Halobacteriales archaeon]
MSGRSSPLYDAHAELDAQFTDFGGWEMPVEYDSIRTEHTAVRETAGKFDVSHMGELVVTGPDAAALCDRLVTNDVRSMAIGDARYALITDADGVILDDTMVYRRADAEYLVIPNAGHDAQMYDRWVDHRDEWGLDADVENATEALAMIALQGPEAAALVEPVADDAVTDLDHMEATWAEVAGVETYAARTGYTGEDGFEFVYPAADAEAVWDALDCQACGLGARDTLRTEMGFLLSGQDFDPEENPRTPYEAGVGFAVKLDGEFVGRDALAAVAEAGPEQSFVGLGLTERGIPRHGYAITDPDGDEIGVVTSGTMSPTLGEPIGLGYVDADHVAPGTDVRVVIRDDPKTAKIRETPF